MKPIYLDYNATTPVDQRVVDAMLPYFTEDFGNAASIDHAYGHDANLAVERAREQVAALVGASPEEIIFTSGATEADNVAIIGTLARSADDAELIVSSIEHPAVLEAAARLGDRLRIAPVSSDGIVDPAEIKQRLTSKTALVSVMAANNETGAIQPIDEIGSICAEADVPFHSDAVQAAARIDVNVNQARLSLLSLSAHKIYGPKGIGAMYARRRGGRIKLAPLQYGGGQERNMRPGTLNVPGIVGFGVAADLARRNRRPEAIREQRLKAQLIDGLMAIGEINLNTPANCSLPQTVSARIAGVGARALMHATRADLAFSSGSACTTTKIEPSHVLLAQGVPPQAAGESVRLSFGRFTTDDDIARTSAVLATAIEHLRHIGALAAECVGGAARPLGSAHVT
jgi:cysteine desulfurase